MTITQTVEIPANHRLIIDVPNEVPSGQVILTFTPNAAAQNTTQSRKPLSKQFAGALRLSDTAYEALQDSLQEGRGEWNRNIF